MTLPSVPPSSGLPASNRSLWVETSKAPEHPPLTTELHTDVVVIGAGVFGLSTALMLREAGYSVAVLEAAQVATGVSGYTTGKVSSLHQVKYAQLTLSHGPDGARTYGEANEAALRQVERWVEQYGIDCSLERQPAYLYARNHAEALVVAAELAAARKAGLPVEEADDPGLPFAVKRALRFRDQLLYHVRRYCLGLAEAFVAAGGQIYEQTRVTDLQETEHEVTVQTRRGPLVFARHVVQATLIPFWDRGGYFARERPSRSYLIAARLAEPALEAMYINALPPVRSLRPALGGQYVLVGGESHTVGQEPDTWGRYEALEAFAREHFAVESIDYRWSSQDFVPAGGLPFIGRMPTTDRVYVGTGFQKWGLSLGTAAAKVIVEGIEGRTSAFAELTDAARLEPVREALGVTGRGLDFTKHMVSERIRALKVPAAETLKAGEGAIASHDGGRVAAYRGEDGHLHLVSPVCTHMGCYVTWNPAETAWDCPCHGSRFGTDGRVLQGPAVEDLPCRK